MPVGLTEKHCVACEGGVPPLSDAQEDQYMSEVPNWTLERSGVHKIAKEFTFDSFREAVAFIGKVADLAEEEGHHPDIHDYYNKVQLELYTHAVQGLVENDFIMAAKIDRVEQELKDSAKQKRQITIDGTPHNLAGKELRVGDLAPDFMATGNDLAPVRLSSFSGKTILISSVFSLETAVCDAETRRFNEEASRLGGEVKILTLSMDTPFTQERWCGAAGISSLSTLSDHKEASFGRAYGVLIEDLRLLARAVFVIDKAGIIRYSQIVDEVSKEPDYTAALEAVRALA